jgi:hypothetical protein
LKNIYYKWQNSKSKPVCGWRVISNVKIFNIQGVFSDLYEICPLLFGAFYK